MSGKQKITKLFKNLSFIGLYILFLFLCIIVADKIYAKYEKVPFQYSEIRINTWGDERFAFKASNIPGLEYEMVPYSKLNNLETNSVGIRDKEYVIPKPANTIRVLILGDSVSYGQFINQKDVFSTLLEEKLNNGSNYTKYEIINASIPGYNTMQEYIAFVNKWYIYKPDLLLVCFNPTDLAPTFIHLNDRNGLIYHHIKSKSTQSEVITHMTYNEILSIFMPNIFKLPPFIHIKSMLHSSIYRVITIRVYDFLNRKNKYKYPPRIYLNLAETQVKDAIEQLKVYCKDNNIDLLFILIPFLYDTLPSYLNDDLDRVKKILEDNSTVYIDLTPFYKNNIDRLTKIAFNPKMGDYIHLNVLGHKLTAETLYSYLTAYFKNK